MGKINIGRMILGGLLAGLIFNIGEIILNGFIFGDAWQEWSMQHNFAEMGTGGYLLMIVLLFALGIFSVWLYAGIRPRFSPGPRTAIYSGLAVWLVASVYPTLTMVTMAMSPATMVVIGLVWSLVEVLLGTYLGCWFYREEPAARTVSEGTP